MGIRIDCKYNGRLGMMGNILQLYCGDVGKTVAILKIISLRT